MMTEEFLADFWQIFCDESTELLGASVWYDGDGNQLLRLEYKCADGKVREANFHRNALQGIIRAGVRAELKNMHAKDKIVGEGDEGGEGETV